MFICDSGADRIKNASSVVGVFGTALYLTDNHQMLAIPTSDRKRGGSPRPCRRVALLNRRLNVLRIAIHAPHDNHVLQPPSNEQFATIHEPEIPRAKVYFSIVRIQASLECLTGLNGALPVTASATRTIDPDLTNLIIAQRAPCFRMNNQHLFFFKHLPTTDQRSCVGVILRNAGNTVLNQIVLVERANNGRFVLLPSGDNQRCLGHSVAGVMNVRTESVRRELFGKRIHDIGPDRLGSVERKIPTAEI